MGTLTFLLAHLRLAVSIELVGPLRNHCVQIIHFLDEEIWTDKGDLS